MIEAPQVDGGDAARIAALSSALADLEAVVVDLPPESAAQPTGCPGWSVFDIVAHCVSLESLVAGDQPPDHELEVEPSHVQNDASRFMEVLVDAWRDVDFDTLRKAMSDVFQRRQQQLAGLTDLDGDLQGFLGPTPARRLLGIRTFDLWIHEQDVRRAVGRTGGFDTAPAVVSARRMLKGLGAMLPTRISGGSLDLVVTGDQASHTTIDLGDGDGHVSITIPFEALVPIVAGREDARDPASVAVIEGDAGLAAQILTSLVITP